MLALDDHLPHVEGSGHQTGRRPAGRVLGAAARGGARRASAPMAYPVAAAEHGADANKRSSTTGASMQQQQQAPKTIKKDGEDDGG